MMNSPTTNDKLHNLIKALPTFQKEALADKLDVSLRHISWIGKNLGKLKLQQADIIAKHLAAFYGEEVVNGCFVLSHSKLLRES